jgi:Ca2+-binding RTX toxin-like protein
LVFISDGEPNRALNNSGQVVDTTASVAMQHILGTYNPSGSSNDDNVSEVSLIETAGPGTAPAFTIESIGINVDGTALNLLSQVEGSGGSATNVTTASQLTSTLGTLTGASVITDAAGDDVIHGKDGADLIFGDAINTDVLAASHGLTTPPGAGWLVFQQLEAGSSGWTRADTLDYLKNHQAELAVESGRSGGNDSINAGAGDDIVYGQEGNDFLVGGTGDDDLLGGSGADIFAYSALGGEGDDTIADFSLAEGDVLRFYDVLDDGSGTLDADDVNVTVNVSGADVELTINGSTTVTMSGVNSELGLDQGAHSLGDLVSGGMNVQFDPNSHSV